MKNIPDTLSFNVVYMSETLGRMLMVDKEISD